MKKYIIILLSAATVISCSETIENVEVVTETVENKEAVEVSKFKFDAMSELDSLGNAEQEKLDTGVDVLGTEKQHIVDLGALILKMNDAILAEDVVFADNIENWNATRIALNDKNNSKLDSLSLAFEFVSEIDELAVLSDEINLLEARITDLSNEYSELFKK